MWGCKLWFIPLTAKITHNFPSTAHWIRKSVVLGKLTEFTSPIVQHQTIFNKKTFSIHCHRLISPSTDSESLRKAIKSYEKFSNTFAWKANSAKCDDYTTWRLHVTQTPTTCMRWWKFQWPSHSKARNKKHFHAMSRSSVHGNFSFHLHDYRFSFAAFLQSFFLTFRQRIVSNNCTTMWKNVHQVGSEKCSHCARATISRYLKA